MKEASLQLHAGFLDSRRQLVVVRFQGAGIAKMGITELTIAVRPLANSVLPMVVIYWRGRLFRLPTALGMM